MDLISIERRSGLAFDIRVRDRRLESDMAPADGGRGDGFTPVELFAGALGACMAMTVQRWCEASGNGVGDVAASVTLELASDPTRIGAIIIDLEAPEGITEERHKALQRVIEHCIIQETLRDPPRVDVEIL